MNTALAATLEQARFTAMLAGDLRLGGAVLPPTASNADVMSVFEADQEVLGAVIVDGERPIGLINRNTFYSQFARPFHRELFLRRSCQVFMDGSPIIASADTTIPDVGAIVAEIGPKGLTDGVIVTRNGAYDGLCDGLTLLRALSDLQGEQHRQLLSSIDYASTIQNALLADSRAALQKAFGAKHTVIWEPRDTVGGDCFFAVHDDAGVLMGLIDCTGHGVPGALLTSIAISEANRLAADADLRRNPAQLLTRLNQRVKIALQQTSEDGDSTADDGMDAVFMWVDHNRDTARAASARLPIFIAGADGTIETLKGCRKGLGYRETPLDYEWAEHVVDLKPGMRVFMATDGVGDQLGEQIPIAFGWNRFREAVSSAAQGGVLGQTHAGWQAFNSWQGRQARRDDITILGAEIGVPLTVGG